MRIIYLGGDNDMQWLRTTHWQNLPADARCALLHGNEDAPEKIEAWRSDNPKHQQPADYTLTPVRFVQPFEGEQ
jgi:hypothetical protein